MWVLVIALVIIILILLGNISFKNHCIEDLEKWNTRLAEIKDSKIMEILFKVYELSDYRKSYSKVAIREYINKEIAMRTINTKKELNIAGNDNV